MEHLGRLAYCSECAAIAAEVCSQCGRGSCCRSRQCSVCLALEPELCVGGASFERDAPGEEARAAARFVRQRLAEPVEPGSAGAGRDTAIELECIRDVEIPEACGGGAAAETLREWLPVSGVHEARRLEALRQSLRGAAESCVAPAPEAPAAFDPELGLAPAFSVGAGGEVLDGRQQPVRWPWEGPEPCAATSPGALGAEARRVGLSIQEGAAPPFDVVARDHFAVASPLGTDTLGAHAADATVLAGLNAATSDGTGGENSTGVRAYKRFCKKYNRAVLRPVDPNAPLWVKLSEEVWAMRFVSELIDDRSVAVQTARDYFGAASAWHLRKTGIGFAAGMCMSRLKEMVKGLRKLRDSPPSKIRRGISPQQLRAGMDLVFPPVSPENVNIRAMLAVGLQGLMRGRELGCEGRFDPELDLARGDLATVTEARLAFFMRPAKNMRHRRGKTVPLVIGGGGEFVDACLEVQRMLALDPTPVGAGAETPMFRKSDGSAYTTDDIRNVVRQIAFAVGIDPEELGAHSLRIGGATALFAAGADPMVIRTMGRWSSDCYRLYVRACFEQTVAWTRSLGSQCVHDVQGTYERRAQETEEY